MQRAALAVAEYPGELEDAPLARRQQFLAGKFRRGVQIEPREAPSGAASAVAKACKWVSLPGETCKAPVSTSTKSWPGEPGAQAATIAAPGQQAGRRSAWTRGPKRAKNGGRIGRCMALVEPETFEEIATRSGSGSVWCARELTASNTEEAVKVIASSLRKGNIVEIDGKLGVIMAIENIHPGKGTRSPRWTCAGSPTA